MSARSERKAPVRELVRETVANAILEAAEAVAADRGPDGASIAAIAERVGVAVGTLYNYFPDRDAMFAALFKARRDAIQPRIMALPELLPPLSEKSEKRAGHAALVGQVETRLRLYLEGVLGVLEDHRNYCRMAVLDDGTFARIKGRHRPVLETMIEVIAEIVKPLVGADVAAGQARMISGAMRAMLRERLEKGTPLAPDGAVIASTFVRGMAAATSG